MAPTNTNERSRPITQFMILLCPKLKLTIFFYSVSSWGSYTVLQTTNKRNLVINHSHTHIRRQSRKYLLALLEIHKSDTHKLPQKVLKHNSVHFSLLNNDTVLSSIRSIPSTDGNVNVWHTRTHTQVHPFWLNTTESIVHASVNIFHKNYQKQTHRGFHGTASGGKN